MTGHAEGIIRVNIEEASNAVGERVREEVHEHYRFFGHLRHEVAAPQRNYEHGPMPGWEQQHVRLRRRASEGGLSRNLGTLSARGGYTRYRAQLWLG